MAINSNTANSHLRGARSTLNNLADAQKIQNIVSEHALDLFNVLGEKKIDVDADLKVIIHHINTRLGIGGATFIGVVRNEIRNIDAQLAGLPANKGNRDAIKSLNDKKSLLTTIATAGGNVTDRANEIAVLHNHINIFNINGKIDEDTVDISRSPVVLGGAGWPQNLETIFFSGTLPAVPSYNFSNENGETLIGDAINGYKISIGGTEYTIKGLSVTGVPHPNQLSIDQNNFSIAPIPSYPFELNLHLSAAFENVNVGGESIIIKETKPLKLTLNNGAPLVKMDTAALRNAEIDAYNGAGVNPGAITRSLDARYRNEGLKMQKQAVFDALKKLDGPKFDKLNDAQKDEFFNTIYTRYNDPTTSPGVTINGVTTSWIHYIQNINSYAGMRDWMSADDHESNTPEHTKSSEAYRNYVHNNLEDQTGKYITAQLGRLFSDDLETNMYLKSELSDFLTNLENRKRDDNTHSQIDAGLQEDAMENTRGGAGIFSRWLGRRDVNYGRFFAGKSSKKIDATIALDTEREGLENNKKYPNPLTYSLQTSSSGDSIKAAITMPGLGELTLKGREPNAIVREILRRTDIPFGKLRCHIAYSFLKNMVQMAKDSHISLNYTDPGTGNKRRIMVNDQNKLIIEEYDDHTNHSTAGAWRRIETNIFNEDMFDNNQVRDSATDNRSLRRGIEGLATEFNVAMNQYHRHYRTATERRRWGLKKGEMRTTLPSNFFLSPIKSMRKWFGAKMDFAFSTSASGGGKSANIEFTGKQFKVTIGDKTYTNNNLGTILNEREGKKRVFDGIEREICAAVYKQLVDKLRENTRVANKHFGVVDPMTKGVYMIDTDGEWSYIEPENANQSNIQRSKFMERAVGATLGAAAGAGVGAGGAALAGSSLFKWSLIGGGMGALTGGFLGGIDSRNSYGEIPHPPMRRRVLSASEKEELYHNPLLMARMIRAMSDGLR